MKISLSENIRRFRKQRKMTQEKLAEALGVTVGAVYKWESGQSLPELNLIVEMADFFDTSIDVLLGYHMKDNRLDSALERINASCRTLDQSALTEAEKILGKYPHSFKAVYGCAEVYLVFGVSNHDTNHLKRALELFEQSKILLSQNDNNRISEITICRNMSVALFLLGDKEKSIELLKQNNAGGILSDHIGIILSVFMNAPEKAVPYLSEAYITGILTLLDVVLGFVFVFRSRGDWCSAMEILNFGVNLLGNIKTDTGHDALEKIHSKLLVMLAYVQLKSGLQAESAASLRKAKVIAIHFDSLPDYTLKTMRFAELQEQSMIFDIFGASASESITELITLLDDQQFADQWREISENESCSS
ncbi:MAG: helix-turn-helix transcriptional regulator [Solobacterium sp.]|nr:helix-turn-helix transcriptional regulator [Solobacterium sp.]